MATIDEQIRLLHIERDNALYEFDVREKALREQLPDELDAEREAEHDA